MVRRSDDLLIPASPEAHKYDDLFGRERVSFYLPVHLLG